MRYKLILIDADDTLFDFQAGNRLAVNRLMAELGLDSPGLFDEYQQINHACWEALERGEMTQDTLQVERFRRFLSLKGRPDDPQRVADRFACLLGEQAIPLPFAEELVYRLSLERPVVILTNGIARIQKSRLSRSPIRRFIKNMVVSQDVGFAKPDPRLFFAALDGVSPGDALMIGDSLSSDILGANRAGIDSCWFNPTGKAPSDGIRATYEVRALADCLPIALS